MAKQCLCLLSRCTVNIIVYFHINVYVYTMLVMVQYVLKVQFEGMELDQ
jgi:hypothetical protein